MTDSQVPEEKFLVLINDLLASGEIPELFADEEIDQIISAITPEVWISLSFLMSEIYRYTSMDILGREDI